MPTLTIAELRDLAARALANAGASETMATATAAALVDAEAQGLSSHGLARVAQYATHLRNGRADGDAAKLYAEEAAQSAPSLSWAGQAVLQLRSAAGDWAGALEMLERNRTAMEKPAGPARTRASR